MLISSPACEKSHRCAKLHERGDHAANHAQHPDDGHHPARNHEEVEDHQDDTKEDEED